jgi:RHS repeat-associated protein
VTQSNASVEFRYGYTGREQDSETGLDYYRARYYDASNGRFISEDPIGFGAGDGNLTRYVKNSPINFTDPSGLRPMTVDPGDATTNWTPPLTPKSTIPPSKTSLIEENVDLVFGKLSDNPQKRASQIESYLRRNPQWKKELPSCPCTEQQAEDEGFEAPFSTGAITQYHPGAYSEYRSLPGEFWLKGQLITKPAQQCTYDKSGNLLTHGAGAGTPDFYGTRNNLFQFSPLHLSIDVNWTFNVWKDYQRYNQTWRPNNGNKCPLNPPTTKENKKCE